MSHSLSRTVSYNLSLVENATKAALTLLNELTSHRIFPVTTILSLFSNLGTIMRYKTEDKSFQMTVHDLWEIRDIVSANICEGFPH